MCRFFLLIMVLFSIEKNLYANIISQVKTDLQKHKTEFVVEKFWQAIEKSGTPIIEKKDKNYFSVTFIAKAADKSMQISLASIDIFSPQLGEKMERIENTDIWFKTVEIERGSGILYGFVQNIPPPFVDTTRAWTQSDREVINLFFDSTYSDPFNKKKKH